LSKKDTVLWAKAQVSVGDLHFIPRPKGTVEKPRIGVRQLADAVFSKVKLLKYKSIFFSKKPQKQAFALPNHFFNSP